jgi:hypothetical protein
MAVIDPEILLESLRYDGTIPAEVYLAEFEEATILQARDGTVIDDELKQIQMANQLRGEAARWYTWRMKGEFDTYTNLVAALRQQYPKRKLTHQELHLQHQREQEIRKEREIRLQDISARRQIPTIKELMARRKQTELIAREAAEQRAREEAAKRAKEYKAKRDAEFARRLTEFFKKSGGWYPQLEEEEDAGQENLGAPGQKVNEERTYDECHDEHPNLGRVLVLKEKRVEQRNVKRWPRIDCEELPSKQMDEQTVEKDVQVP